MSLINIEISEPQAEIFAGRTPIIADIAGQGSGKTLNIGLSVGWFVTSFPKMKGFIGANTYEQLSNSTLNQVFRVLENFFGISEFHQKDNPGGEYTFGKKPPRQWRIKDKYKAYNNIMSFKNGAVVFLGSLENYMSHDGKEFGWAHLDETKDTKEVAVRNVIMSRLRQKGLWTDGIDAFYNESVTNEIAIEKGWKSWNPMYIHTSPGEGNIDWLIEMLGIEPYAREIKDKIMQRNDFFCKIINGNLVVNYSSYWNESNLAMNYISDRLARYSSAESLKYIYGYIFSKTGGEYFPSFDRFKHISNIKYVKGLPLHTAWDFNAAPYVTCLCCHVEYLNRFFDRKSNKKYSEKPDNIEVENLEVLQFRFFREYCTPDGTTELTAENVMNDFSEDKPDIFVNGDASGHSRIEGLGSLTNYKIISNKWQTGFYLQTGWMRAKKVNIQVGKRRDLMNRIWEEKLPEVEIIIDPSCINLIRDCEYLLKDPKTGGKYKEEEKDKNGIKFQKLGHCADAMEYIVCELCKDKFRE